MVTDTEILQTALFGYDEQKRVIEEKQTAIRQQLQLKVNGQEPARVLTLEGGAVEQAEEPRPRKVMSASARKRIGAAQRKRWAKLRRETAAAKR